MDAEAFVAMMKSRGILDRVQYLLANANAKAAPIQTDDFFKSIFSYKKPRDSAIVNGETWCGVKTSATTEEPCWHMTLREWLTHDPMGVVPECRARDVICSSTMTSHCKGCGDRFELYYDDDEEEWRMRDSILLTACLFHVYCLPFDCCLDRENWWDFIRKILMDLLIIEEE